MGKRSAGVFLLREDRGEIQFLALAGRNSWDLPKGGIKSAETPFEAAERELEEETGISDVEWNTPKEQPFSVHYLLKSRGVKEVLFFLATTTKSKVKVSSEHESFRWIPLTEAKEYLPERFHEVADWVMGMMHVQGAA